MDINEEKAQETTPSTTATLEAASDEAITDINVPNTRDASQAEELFGAGQSGSKRSKTQKVSKTSKTAKALKGARSLTSEEKAVIIAKAEEIGAAKAAREFGINYYTVYTWLKQGKKKASEQSSTSDEQLIQSETRTQGKAYDRKQSKSRQKKEAAKAAQVEEIREIKREDVPVAHVEAVAPDKPVGTSELNNPSELTKKKAVYAAQTDANQALLIENAILRERISAQKAEIEKLQAAIKSLMV